MAKTRRHNRKRASRKHRARSVSVSRHARMRAGRRSRRITRVRRRGGSMNRVDDTFVNDALPYGEYRTSKGIRSGFQIRR